MVRARPFDFAQGRLSDSRRDGGATPEKRHPMPVRYTSSATFLEVPLISLAVGPDLGNNQPRGHARGVIAIGDIATGVIAVGGFARGLVAVGGLAIGGFTLSGLGLGFLAIGGFALGYIAIGGLAIGYGAIGGLAVGYYAIGGAPIGKFVIGPLHHDPEAVEFFTRLMHRLVILPKIPPG
jgi:hypothetical protein